MATTVVLNDVIVNPDGSVQVNWADGRGQTFQNIQEIQDNIATRDNDVELTKDLALSWLLARSPDLSNDSQLAGKNFTFDLSSQNAIKVQ